MNTQQAFRAAYKALRSGRCGRSGQGFGSLELSTAVLAAKGNLDAVKAASEAANLPFSGPWPVGIVAALRGVANAKYRRYIVSSWRLSRGIVLRGD